MTSTNIYEDIVERTGGNIYIGVVGPVRTGKSTFIRKVMEHLVLDEIDDSFLRERTIDELPQASTGKTIMTTEPKFVPENAIKISLDNHIKCNIRMVDCVGFVVDGAIGQMEGDAPRMVHTPWSKDDIPFERAAEIGTNRVIVEHSTIGVVVTTDGSIGELSRNDYVEAERRVISEMKKTGKPFVVLLNSMFPTGEQALMIQRSIQEEYNVPVIAKNCLELEREDVVMVLSMILSEFPISKVELELPSWITYLPADNAIKHEIYTCLRNCAEKYKTMRQLSDLCSELCKNQFVISSSVIESELGDGSTKIELKVPQYLYFSLISEILGHEITDDGALLMELKKLNDMRESYEKIRVAFEVAKTQGYGIVKPDKCDLTIEAPTQYRQGNRFGIKIKAMAPTYHIIKADIDSEISPIVGDEEQSNVLMEFVNANLKENVDHIWDYNIFGKTIYDMVKDGLEGKFCRLPDDSRLKLQETLSKILNEGSGGLICIIL